MKKTRENLRMITGTKRKRNTRNTMENRPRSFLNGRWSPRITP